MPIQRFLLGIGYQIACLLVGGMISIELVHATELLRMTPSRIIEFEVHREEKPAVMTGVAISGDGLYLAAASDDHLVRVWNRVTGQLLHRLAGHEDWIRCIAFSPDGKTLASAGNDRKILFWDVATGQYLRATDPISAAICAIAFDRDGKQLATAGFDQMLRIYDCFSCRCQVELQCASTDLRTVAFSPDGNRLASAGRNGTIRIWALPSGTVERDIPADRRRIRSIAFSPSGRRLVSAGDGETIRIWDISTGALQMELPARPAKIMAVLFTRENEIYTGGTDNMIRQWNLDTRSAGWELIGHTGTVASLACNRGGDWLISGSYDTTIRIWDLRTIQSANTAQHPIQTTITD